MKTFQRKQLAQAIAISVALGSASLAQAQFEEVTGNKNPFNAVTSGGEKPSIVIMDLDNDGDLDLVMFHQYTDDGFTFDDSFISVWENTGSNTKASFTQVADYESYGHLGDGSYGYGYGAGGYGTGDNIEGNPFTGGGDFYGHPVTAFDINGDGTLDFIAGSAESYTSYRLSYLRVETDSEGVVTGLNRFDAEDSRSGNRFYGSNLTPSATGYGYGTALAAGDLTNNGRPDIIAVDHDTLRLFENVNTVDGRFQFVEVTTGIFPLDLESSAHFGAPIVLNDIDGDGDLDLVMGTRDAGNMRLFLNKGSAATPDFEEVTNKADELGLDISTRGWAAPTFADINGNGLDDLIIVERYEEVREPKIMAPTETLQEIRLFTRVAKEDEEPTDEEEGETTTEEKKKKGKLFGGLGSTLLAGFGLLLFRRRR